jgi:hypothetical protein
LIEPSPADGLLFAHLLQDYGELEQSIRAVLSKRSLQQPSPFVTKVVQLYETMNVRFGVMLVGPTGGGKTACYQALQGALTRLRQELRHHNDKYQVRDVNIAAVKDAALSHMVTRGDQSNFDDWMHPSIGWCGSCKDQ